MFATALASAGQYEKSRQVEQTILLREATPRPSIADRKQREERRRLTSLMSVAILTLYTLLTARTVHNGWGLLRAARPRGLLILATGFLGAALLSHLWEPGAAAAIPWMGFGACLIHMWTLAALGLPHATGTKRWIRAGSFLATLA